MLPYKFNNHVLCKGAFPFQITPGEVSALFAQLKITGLICSPSTQWPRRRLPIS